VIRLTANGPKAVGRRDAVALDALDRRYGISAIVRRMGWPGYMPEVIPILRGAGLKVEAPLDLLRQIDRELSPLKGWNGKEYTWLDTWRKFHPEIERVRKKLERFELHPFARDDVAEIAATREQAIIAYEPGLGKTRTSLAIAYAWGSKRVLIVVPGRLREQWKREIKTFFGGKPPFEYAILSYEQLVREEDEFARYDTAILDEAHYIKNPETERFKAAMKLAATRRIALTGTPIGGYVDDLIGIVKWITAQRPYLDRLGPDFRERFSYTNGSRRAPGIKLAGVLRDKLAHIIKIRTREEPEVSIANQVPKMRLIRIQFERELRDFYLQNARKIREWWLSLENPSEAKARLGIHRIVKAAVLPQSLSGWGAKETRLQRKVLELVEQHRHRNPIVIASHIDVAKFYADRLGVKAVTSRIPIKRRQDIIDQWREHGGVLVGTIGVLGEGWNFQHSGTIIFAEPDWKATLIIQAIFRVLRPGQRWQPEIIFVSYANSVLDYMYEVVAEKSKAMTALNRGQDIKGRMPSFRHLMMKLVVEAQGERRHRSRR